MEHENLIPWHLIDKKYKHARMDECRSMYVHRYIPKISIQGMAWSDNKEEYYCITGLVTGYVSELDWKTFEATRPAEVKMETKKVYYTKEMEDNKEMPLIDMYFLSVNGESRVISTSTHDNGVITYTYNNGQSIECCWFHSDNVKRVDTRADSEKLIDDVADFLIDNDEDSTFICRDSALNIASYLFKSSKFTITKKGD